jgi:hypothetical protein
MMSNQTNQRELNDFELQINLEDAFAQLECDDNNASLLKSLETIVYLAQNQSIQNVATQIGKTYNEAINYISYCKQRLMQYPPIRSCWERISNQSILTPDEQDWIDLLAGKSVPDAVPEIVRETQIFRAALLSYSDKPKDADEIPYPHILEKVLARLKAEKQQPISKKKFKKWRSLFTKQSCPTEI